MMMVIEPAGPGIKITYRMLGPDGKAMDQSVVTVVTALDGKEAPMMIDGKAIGADDGNAAHRCQSRDDDHQDAGKGLWEVHNGALAGRQNDEGRERFQRNEPVGGKQVEYWDRK